jgi:hypothetical protein
LDTGRLDEAEALTRRGVEGMQRVLGPANMDTLWAETNLARILRAQGRLAEAETLLREVRDRQREISGEDSPTVRALSREYGALVEELARSSQAAPKVPGGD